MPSKVKYSDRGINMESVIFDIVWKVIFLIMGSIGSFMAWILKRTISDAFLKISKVESDTAAIEKSMNTSLHEIMITLTSINGKMSNFEKSGTEIEDLKKRVIELEKWKAIQENS